uniref:Uncharacterized protein n=1 Tax=Cyprinodon variegatus TaxID=28743 RepID=A0A3Q2DLM8_CYPVA
NRIYQSFRDPHALILYIYTLTSISNRWYRPILHSQVSGICIGAKKWHWCSTSFYFLSSSFFSDLRIEISNIINGHPDICLCVQDGSCFGNRSGSDL